jgi:asparagine synthase (glutamine-hydrolysing)
MSCLDAQNLSNLFNQKITESEIYENLDDIFSNEVNFMRSSQLYHFKYYLPMILSKVDQASMFNSVESRAPFLSKKIINFSLEQDVKSLYKIFRKKFFLKKNFNDVVPKEILQRKKHGFAFPKEKILHDRKFIDNLIDYSILINDKFFEEKYNKFLLNKENCSQYLWNELILNLCIQNLKKIRNF